MPISPSEVKSLIESVDTDWMNKCMDNIDRFLSSTVFVREKMCRDNTDLPCYAMQFDDWLSIGEKKYLTDAYLAVGWSKVDIRNTSKSTWEIALSSDQLDLPNVDFVK